jgi:5-methyltetrahydrofolate--homocysteine methyltransferase
MCHVAREMERQGVTVPLLIGGATTSRVHAAVKIAPCRQAPTVYVTDASRAVGVVGKLMGEQRAVLLAEVASQYAAIRESRKGGDAPARRRSLEEGRRHRLAIDWAAEPPVRRRCPGVHVFAPYDLADLRRTIDWTPFFHIWELKGSYPATFDDPQAGVQARDLYEDAERLLDRIVAGRWLEARGARGLFFSNTDGTRRWRRAASRSSARSQAPSPPSPGAG